MATETIYCARHPNTETGLRCGRCDTPICPKCAIFTDVGARCPDCAPRRKMPQFELGITWIARAVIAAVVVGAVAGGLWGLLIAHGGGFFTLLVGAGVGYCVGESISVMTNRKIGPVLQTIAGMGCVLAFVVHNVVAGVAITGDLFGAIAGIIAIVVAVGRLQI